MATRKIPTPNTLHITSIKTTRLALILEPKLAKTTVMHLPMFMPSKMGSAVEKVMAPVTEVACRRPTAAEELCKTAVTARPSRRPGTGLRNRVNTR